jgi:hypothetical protein
MCRKAFALLHRLLEPVTGFREHGSVYLLARFVH